MGPCVVFFLEIRVKTKILSQKIHWKSMTHFKHKKVWKSNLLYVEGIFFLWNEACWERQGFGITACLG